jgi:hypothetical protein
MLITVCVLATASVATAQKKRYPVHELSVSVSGGQSNMLYKLDGGTHSGGFGGNVDIGYTYNIKLLGIVTGLGISTYNSKLTIAECSSGYSGTDEAGDDFTFNYSLRGYSEKQNAVLFTVPLMVKYSRPLGSGATTYYASGGLKFGIPISAKASINPGTVTTSGYYSFEDGTYTDLPQYGFVTGQPGEQSDYNLKLNVATILALELGLRFRAGYQKHLMTSAYLDYGLNNMQKVNDRHVLEYQPSDPSRFVHNSIINTEMLKKVNLFSFGVKVGLSF